MNDRLGTDLSSEDYDSLGGFIIEHLNDRLPEEGDEVCTEAGVRLVVEKLDKNRVESVHVYLPEMTGDALEPDTASSEEGEKDETTGETAEPHSGEDGDA